MAKIKELGIVKTVHNSGMVETNKGIKSIIRAKVGDRLIQDIETKVISIAVKKTASKQTAKVDTTALELGGE